MSTRRHMNYGGPHRWPMLAPARLLGIADRIRRWWLVRLGGIGRVLVRSREMRVATIFCAVVLSALVGTLLFPLWLLALGPLVWGVPHLVADFRYLVVRTGFAQRRALWIVGGIPLLCIAVGGALAWGFVGGAAVALSARASGRRRLPVAVVMLALAALCVHAGPTADLVFGHVHNFVAVALWWMWRKRVGRAHWLPIALVLAATVLLLSPYAVRGVQWVGAFGWYPGVDDSPLQLWRLAPGLSPTIGLRLVLLFCFMQSVHYAVWIVLLPDEARARATVMTFRASYVDLRRDLGAVAIGVAVVVSLGIAVWAVLDLAAAGRGYFRMARFHGHLELMAAALLLLEGVATAPSPARGARPGR